MHKNVRKYCFFRALKIEDCVFFASLHTSQTIFCNEVYVSDFTFFFPCPELNKLQLPLQLSKGRVRNGAKNFC